MHQYTPEWCERTLTGLDRLYFLDEHPQCGQREINVGLFKENPGVVRRDVADDLSPVQAVQDLP